MILTGLLKSDSYRIVFLIFLFFAFVGVISNKENQLSEPLIASDYMIIIINDSQS